MLKRTLIAGALSCALVLAANSGSPRKLSVAEGGTGSASGDISALIAKVVGTSAAVTIADWLGWNLTVQMWEAKGDGEHDDWEPIQRAMGMDETGYCTRTAPATIHIPPTATNVYRVSQAIRGCPGVTLQVDDDGTTILGTGDATGTDYTGAVNHNQWPVFGLLMVGTVHTAYPSPALMLSGAVERGAQSVTLATPADASKLVVGDLIGIETTQTWAPAGEMATNTKMALVKSTNASTGVVTIDRPLDFASSSVKLRRLSNGARTAGWPTLGNTNIKLFATRDFRVKGGRWVAASATPWFQPFESPGGCLSCSFEPDYINAGSGAGAGNLYQDVKINVREEWVYANPIELAYHSSGVTVAKETVRVSGWPTSRAPVPWDIAFDEGSHDNSVTIGRMEVYSPEIGQVALTGTPAPGGGDVVSATISIPAGATYSASYTAAAGETLSTMASGLAAALNSTGGFVAAGFAATGNPPGASGSVIVTNSAGRVFGVIAAYSGAVTAYLRAKNVIVVTDAYRNAVSVGSIVGSAISGGVVDVSGGAVVGEPLTANNSVSVGSVDLTAYNAGVVVAGAGASGNTVRGGHIGGTLLQPKQFWFQYGVGSKNTIADFDSDSSGGYVQCDRSALSVSNGADVTNVVRNVRTDAPPNALALDGAQIQASRWCTLAGVLSSAGQGLMSLTRTLQSVDASADYVTYIDLGGSTGMVEGGDSVVFTMPFVATGAFAKTGNFQFWFATCTFSIPSDATSGVVRADFSAFATSSIIGTATVQSNSPTSPVAVSTCNSYHSWAGLAASSVQFDKLSGGTFKALRISVAPNVGYSRP